MSSAGAHATPVQGLHLPVLYQELSGPPCCYPQGMDPQSSVTCSARNIRTAEEHSFIVSHILTVETCLASERRQHSLNDIAPYV